MKEDTYSVYVHRTPDGMYYAGVTRNIDNRWQPRHYKKGSLWPYIEKYGWENIEHAVIADGLTYEKSREVEDMLILFYCSIGKGINKLRSGHVFLRDKKRYHREYKRKKYANDQEYAERQRKYQREKLKTNQEYAESQRLRKRERYANDPEYAEHQRQYHAERYANDPEYAERKRQYGQDRRSTPEGKIYNRVKNYNRYHPDRAIETPMEAKLKYLESGYIPNYIKNDDL